jgi:hypothetical protein
MLMNHSPRPVKATTAGRQRRERSRPSGTSRAGRGSGWPVRISWSTQGSKGTVTDQTSPEAANSQPIGLAGRRRVMTSPMVA